MFKPIDPLSTIGVVSVLDPAIDVDGGEWEKFFGKSEDPTDRGLRLQSPEKWRECVAPVSGQKITEYIIGAIPAAKMNEIEDKLHGDSRRQLFWECFLWSLRDIVDGPTVETTDATTGRQKFVVPKLKSGRVDPDWLNKIYVYSNRKIALDIGMQAYLWQMFGNDDARP